MKKPHKHAELIKAWADGAEIEFRWSSSDDWKVVTKPCWDADEYRIKPEPKPDFVYYGVFDSIGSTIIDCCFTNLNDIGDQIKLTFDGETGKLKSAEVL